MTENRRPGRHSYDAEPRWPVADRDPQWPPSDGGSQRPRQPRDPNQPPRRAPQRHAPQRQPHDARTVQPRDARAADGRQAQSRDPRAVGREGPPMHPRDGRGSGQASRPAESRDGRAAGRSGRPAESRDPRARQGRPAQSRDQRGGQAAAGQPRSGDPARRRPQRPAGQGPAGQSQAGQHGGRRAAASAAPGVPSAAQRAHPDRYATEMLPPIDSAAYQISPPREPELLTHRYHDNGGDPQDPGAEDRINAMLADGGEGEPDYDEDALDEDGKPPLTRKQRRWRLFRRFAYGFVGVFVVLPILAFTIAYFLVDIPKPTEIAAAQAKTVNYYFSNGKDLLGRDSQDGNRVILKPEQIPQVVKHAVYAAEDASFETNSGFDISGILRAVKNQLTGGVGGGSTITQQYIKQATGDDEASMIRKGLEVVKAFKMSNELEKPEIITAYLNTIYFGRGAYGIEAASEAYFGKPAKQLKPSQAAYLAGIIQAPSRGDNAEYAEQRWNYVIGQMKQNNWLTGEDAAEAKFPKIKGAAQQIKGFSGPRFYIKQQIAKELEGLTKTTGTDFSDTAVRQQGYKIYTTIDRRAQYLAEDAVKDVMKGQPKNLRKALVAVDPNNGGIKAYYGGPNDDKDRVDWARTPRNPGSSIKPFDFVGLLKQGKGPFATYDGSSPRQFPGDSAPVTNSEGTQCPAPCSVMKAMELSINTVFYDIVVNEVKPSGVIEALKEAGVENTSSLSTKFNQIAIGGADNMISPKDMATAYATFAAEGQRHDGHFISKITTPDGEVVYQAKTKGKAAFDKDKLKSKRIAGNVTKTLVPVLPYANRACADGRACAGKTGTHEAGEDYPGQNSQAWMAGYTRQLSTAVWVGDVGLKPIKNSEGGIIYGSGLPGEIWQQFMDKYHADMDNLPFDDVKPIGEEAPPPPPPPPADDDEDEEKPEDKPDDKPKPPKDPKPTKPTEPTGPTAPTEPTQPCQPPFCRPNDSEGGADPGSGD